VEAVFRQLVGRDVPPDGTRFCHLDHHVPEEVAEPLLRPADEVLGLGEVARVAVRA
jgi:hypothetical protein